MPVHDHFKPVRQAQARVALSKVHVHLIRYIHEDIFAKCSGMHYYMYVFIYKYYQACTPSTGARRFGNGAYISAYIY